MPEEETFAVLVKIMQDYRMREMFKPSMAELGLCMYQLDMLVQEHIPDLYGHFQSQSIHTNLYASSWFLTLYTTALPISLACRYYVDTVDVQKLEKTRAQFLKFCCSAKIVLPNFSARFSRDKVGRRRTVKLSFF